jgi:hypothetical protein
MPSDSLTRCGPCTNGGPPVREVLAQRWAVALLPLSLRAYCLERLTHGERLYGTPLRVGWDRADVEERQEVADALAYALAGKRWVIAVLIGLLWRCL